MMLRRFHHRTLAGVAIILVVTLDADGAVLSWRPEDAATAAHVDLNSLDKWYAVLAMNRAIARMHRGAA